MPFSPPLLCSSPHCCYLSCLLTVSLALLVVSLALLVLAQCYHSTSLTLSLSTCRLIYAIPVIGISASVPIPLSLLSLPTLRSIRL